MKLNQVCHVSSIDKVAFLCVSGKLFFHDITHSHRGQMKYKEQATPLTSHPHISPYARHTSTTGKKKKQKLTQATGKLTSSSWTLTSGPLEYTLLSTSLLSKLLVSLLVLVLPSS